MRTVLVTGGAGYIGSHMIRLLEQQGFYPITLDNLTTGRREAVTVGELVVGSISDTTLIDRLYAKYAFEGVIHFASSLSVGESMQNPALYYENNVKNTIAMLGTLIRLPIRYFILSSTSAIYGDPQYTPMDELHPKLPLSVYGRTKLMLEQVLQDYGLVYPFNYGCLRYFNAAGADPSGTIGPRISANLIPIVLDVALGKTKLVEIFGDDYATPDGSCIRDYIHVNDLCTAHLKLLEYLCAGGKERGFNLGTGKGYTVKEVVEKVEKVTGKTIPRKISGRRAGDPAIVIADGTKAGKLLDWHPQFSSLDQIVTDAWRWVSKGI